MRKFITIFFVIAWTYIHAQHAPKTFTTASWITSSIKKDIVIRPCMVFSRQFSTPKKIAAAKLYITAHGVYEASLNGKRIGKDYFTPGWTSYDKRLQYQEYDISKLIRTNNSIEVTVGEGWYCGAFGADMERNHYGTEPALLCELIIRYRDNSQDTIVSNASWFSGTGPILNAGFYEGETFDARKTVETTQQVVIKEYEKNNLVPPVAEPVRQQESFPALKIFTTPNNEHVVDFGQNIAGWVRFSINGKVGDTVRISHAEVLDKNGNFYTGNLRLAKAEDIYILKDGSQTLEPHFTYHGFRYAKVEGITGKLNPADFSAVAIYSDLEKVGSFECSDSLINRLQKNIIWSLNSNFVDIPTDCPQRSERFGWTADAQVFISTAALNRNVKNFFTKWCADLAEDQATDGSVPRIIPDFYGDRSTKSKGGVAGWGDATTIIPWTLFQFYNDTALLDQQYPVMKKWVDFIASQSMDYLWNANGYGDWLAPGPNTELPYIDQCFFIYSTQLLIKAAKVLNKSEDIGKYSALHEKITTAFLNEYITPDGRCVSNTQTAYLLALQFDLLPENMRAKSARRLSELIRANQNHLSTGFLGTPYLLKVLSRFGYIDLAYTLLKQETYPSWLYPVKKGATTIWEKWDAILPDSNVQATSYNHYAYGAVGEWLYQYIGGIKPAAPGFKEIMIQPHIGGGLTYANTSFQSLNGEIKSSWKIDGAKLSMDVVVPSSTKATIYLPQKDGSWSDGITVEPGRYHYVIEWAPHAVESHDNPPGNSSERRPNN